MFQRKPKPMQHHKLHTPPPPGPFHRPGPKRRGCLSPIIGMMFAVGIVAALLNWIF